MSRLRPKVSLSTEEAEALEAHPEFKGSLGGLLRVLAMRQLGLTPSDPYAAHRSRTRDEKGKMTSMLMYDVFYKGAEFDSSVKLPKPSKDILYAVPVNGARQILVPNGSEWVEVAEIPSRR